MDRIGIERIAEIMLDVDPLELYDRSANNVDEYYPEAKEANNIIHTCKGLNDFEVNLIEIFNRSFRGENIDPGMIHQIAEKIWDCK